MWAPGFIRLEVKGREKTGLEVWLDTSGGRHHFVAGVVSLGRCDKSIGIGVETPAFLASRFN